jgi:hypothetical protein
MQHLMHDDARDQFNKLHSESENKGAGPGRWEGTAWSDEGHLIRQARRE